MTNFWNSESRKGDRIDKADELNEVTDKKRCKMVQIRQKLFLAELQRNLKFGDGGQ